MDESKKLIMKILEITDYDGDPEDFIDMFNGLVFEDAVKSLIESLPKVRRGGAAKKWDANTQNRPALVSFLQHHFTPEQQEKAMQDAASKAIAGYLSSIDGKLNNEKRRMLFKLSQQLQPFH
jgi:hypothetical protein